MYQSVTPVDDRSEHPPARDPRVLASGVRFALLTLCRILCHSSSPSLNFIPAAHLYPCLPGLGSLLDQREPELNRRKKDSYLQPVQIERTEKVEDQRNIGSRNRNIWNKSPFVHNFFTIYYLIFLRYLSNMLLKIGILFSVTHVCVIVTPCVTHFPSHLVNTEFSFKIKFGKMKSI